SPSEKRGKEHFQRYRTGSKSYLRISERRTSCQRVMPVRVIQTERIGYERKEIELILEKMDPESAFTVQRHVYYPYLFFEYMLNRKGFFHPLEGNIGCTVDGVNKIGALADTFPRLEKKTVPRQAVIENTLELTDAEPIAENF